jgi:hypothetical protein
MAVLAMSEKTGEATSSNFLGESIQTKINPAL